MEQAIREHSQEQNGFLGMSYGSGKVEQVIKELARFLEIPFDEAKKRVEQYSVLMTAEKWEARKPKTREEVEGFYKDEDFYLYELIPWNYNNPVYQERIAPLLHYHNSNILEIGAGIGSLCIALAYAGNKVTYCDISNTLCQFATQRFGERGFAIPIVQNLVGLRDFDIVVANDFFEHIHKDALPGMLKEIAAVLKDGGILYHRSNWGQQDIFPMHFNHSEYFNKMAVDAGLIARANGDLVKGGHTDGVQIGIPINGPMEDEIFYSLMGLHKPSGCLVTKIKAASVDIARNDIVSKLERDWLFFMDSDQTFPPETLERLISWDLPIVSGLYFKSPGKPVPHAYRYMWEEAKKYPEKEQDQADHFYMSLINEVAAYLLRFRDQIKDGLPTALLPTKREDLIECDGVGGGCLLIHRRVFEAIEKPYFKCNPGTFIGDDFYFCRKVQEAGFKIYLDPGILCGHKEKDLIGYRHFLNFFSLANRKDIEWPFPWGE